MNTGILDAINLAWKLAGVLKGKAADSLLDNYQVERQACTRAQGIALGSVGLSNDIGGAVAAMLLDAMAWANGTTFDLLGGQLL